MISPRPVSEDVNDAFNPDYDVFLIEIDKIDDIAHARQRRHFKRPINAVEAEFDNKRQ
jgi:hypothetical protein